MPRIAESRESIKPANQMSCHPISRIIKGNMRSKTTRVAYVLQHDSATLHGGMESSVQ